MSTGLLIVTCGRDQYLEATWESARQQLHCQWSWVFVIDDSADPDHHRYVQKLIGPDHHWKHEQRMGGAQAIRTAWGHIRSFPLDYIFHLEDDWTFPHAVTVADMQWVLDREPSIANIALRRDPSPWDPGGDYIDGQHDKFVEHTTLQKSRTYLTHDLGFWLNPCLYPTSVCDRDWPAHGTEADFTATLRDRHFAVYGSKVDPPRAVHIGETRPAGWSW